MFMSVLFGFVFVWFVLVRLSMSELLLLGMLMSSDIGRNRRVVSIFVLFVVNVNHFSVENSQFCVPMFEYFPPRHADEP